MATDATLNATGRTRFSVELTNEIGPAVGDDDNEDGDHGRKRGRRDAPPTDRDTASELYDAERFKASACGGGHTAKECAKT